MQMYFNLISDDDMEVLKSNYCYIESRRHLLQELSTGKVPKVPVKLHGCKRAALVPSSEDSSLFPSHLTDVIANSGSLVITEMGVNWEQNHFIRTLFFVSSPRAFFLLATVGALRHTNVAMCLTGGSGVNTIVSFQAAQALGK